MPGRFKIIPALEFPPRPDGGGRTFELPVSSDGVANTEAFVWGQRAAGTISGRHYHRGLSPSKAPEVFLLLRGQAIWRIRDLYPAGAIAPEMAPQPGREPLPGGNPLGERPALLEPPPLVEYPVEGPCTVLIRPGVWHELEAITAVEFLELNSIADHAADTFTDFM